MIDAAVVKPEYLKKETVFSIDTFEIKNGEKKYCGTIKFNHLQHLVDYCLTLNHKKFICKAVWNEWTNWDKVFEG